MVRPTLFLRPLLALVTIGLVSGQGNGARQYSFALVPKSVENPFFLPARDGCRDYAALNGHTCLFVGPSDDDSDGSKQVSVVQEIVRARSVDGIAVSVRNAELMTPVINHAVNMGIPVVTFDSDAPDSARRTYVGTNNYFFGTQIAKVLKQLQPPGGIYGVVSNLDPNIVERLQGFQDEISSGGEWTEVSHPSDNKANTTIAVEQMQEFIDEGASAVAAVFGSPMRDEGWRAFVDANRDLGPTIVCGDANNLQLFLLDRGYVGGLVGQLPYEMGMKSLEVLTSLLDGESKQETVGTNVLTHIMVPLKLPELIVDHNLVGNLHIVGFILFGLVGISSCCIGVWTYQMRNVRVIKVAQPVFLGMVAIGVLVMATSLIPLSFDDGGNEDSLSDQKSALICMGAPWSGCCGFTIIFAALFSKTRRVNIIFHSQSDFSRVKVTVADVMTPFAVLLSLNVIVLACWTAIDPLMYVRLDNPGTDGWNRILSTYGSCQSDSGVVYLVFLVVINLGVLLIANWQAYVSRSLESEFSESRYIAMANASLLQATISGVPILFVVRKNPEAFYLVLVFMIFAICMAILLLIFVPKIVLAQSFLQHPEPEQRRMILNSIRRSFPPVEIQEA